ncbi:hypothetical protein NEDG_00677 [Nematocida displodere]|uniref:Transcription factor IIIC subunit 5 HTH domain-containing protein n=1 Tax=Nematocida displodere TaxID=1805483 RepID=A0A177EC68_9MICR|nr:hypothetical protein NEDG_00677 [Nematocida displodere]
MTPAQTSTEASTEASTVVALPFEVSGAIYSSGAIALTGEVHKQWIKLEKTKTEGEWCVGEIVGGRVARVKKAETVLTPALADFYLPPFASSESFFREVDELLLSGSGDATPPHFLNTFLLTNKAPVPFFPIPRLTLSAVFKQYNFKEFKNTKTKTIRAARIRIEEEPPEHPSPRLEKELKKRLAEIFQPLKEVVLGAFSERAIWPVKGLEAFCMNKAPSLFKRHKWTTAKNMLPLVAYTYRTGPWKKLWVKYGYNPTLHPPAYIYQVYVWKNVSKAFAIIDDPSIAEAIAQHPQYTTTLFNPKTGFLTPECHEFLRQRLSSIPVREDAPTSLLDGLDFETLDD